ncbi:hypothetical protein KC19_VG223100 [Ceratodon purpureus]|uniref:Uncharacterized protein n=1 Tax=Ceratodon purpureus TaxID=3225 RepID=A0A8T0HTX9_CERPU|nr:hypothetical protein KC19_VG223100 [Ceratodon purpureus]
MLQCHPCSYVRIQVHDIDWSMVHYSDNLNHLKKTRRNRGEKHVIMNARESWPFYVRRKASSRNFVWHRCTQSTESSSTFGDGSSRTGRRGFCAVDEPFFFRACPQKSLSAFACPTTAQGAVWMMPYLALFPIATLPL